MGKKIIINEIFDTGNLTQNGIAESRFRNS